VAIALAALSAAACSSAPDGARDAGGEPDAAPDAAGCVPVTLLTGGSDVTGQGWSVVQLPQATLSNGADFVELATARNGSAGSTSGQLLLSYPRAVDPAMPFKLEIVLRVDRVDAHNQFDSAAAIMGSFDPPFGSSTQRAQMVYLDADRIGWADDSQSATISLLDSNYHTFELAVDGNAAARISVDGVAMLSRAGFLSNGAIALGDQTNDLNVDSALRIRSVTRRCP
jgi:hypothetical protein